MTTGQFLDRLFAGVDHGLVEVRATPSGQRTWTELGHWTALGPFVSHAVTRRENVFVGLATRRDATRGDAENLHTLAMVGTDIDRPPTLVRDLLADYPFRWSLLVASGTGTHVYWQLRDSLDVSTPAGVHRAASLLRRLSAHLDADDRATSPAQALRLANTRNFKYGDPPRPVLVLDETPATVNVSELEDFLPPERVHQRRHEMTIDATIPNGQRNDTLYLLVRSLRCKGVPFTVITEAVHVINDKLCEEPLPGHEIEQLLHYALRQPNRIGFVAPTPLPTLVHSEPRPGEQEPAWALTPPPIRPDAAALVATLLAETPTGTLAGQDVLTRARAAAISDRTIRHALREAGRVARYHGRGATRRTFWVERPRGER